MKIFTFFILIFCFTEAYTQEIINYRVKKKSIPILEKSDGKIIARVPRNEVITFVEYTDSCGCFYVQYKTISGVIDSTSLLDDVYGNDAVKPGRDKIMTMLISKLDPDLQSAELKRRSELVRKYGYPEGVRVAEKKIWIGMTVDMALDSWGIPYKIKRNKTDWGQTEQWIYSEAYLYFENGILAEIMTIKASDR